MHSDMSNVNRSTVYVYNGEGSNKDCEEAMVGSLRIYRGLTSVEIIKVDHSHLKQDKWKDGAALIWGGGYAVAMEKTAQTVSENVKDFVSNGGGYLGVCAGAIIASCNISERGKVEIWNSLDLYPGTSATARASEIITDTGARMHSYWNLGCLFPKNTGALTDPKVVATYADLSGKYVDSPAIISMPHDKGNVVLCGIHPEIIVNDFFPSHLKKMPSYKELSEDRDDQIALFNKVCTLAKVPSRLDEV
jgi:biotin--protein ligase